MLKTLPDCSVDAIVTDPPYGLSNTKPAQVADTIKRWAQGDTEYIPDAEGYMRQEWDSFVPPPAVWEECLRVLKSGGHLLAFAGSRTQDLMSMSIRLAGFDIRDTIAWLRSNGFPRSLDYGRQLLNLGHEEMGEEYRDWRSTLKPSNDPIIVARKPLSEPTIARNIAEHGTGALNIGDCRYGDFQARDAKPCVGRTMLGGSHNIEHLRRLAAAGAKTPNGDDAATTLHRFETAEERIAKTPKSKPGRWPANTIIDDAVVTDLGEKSKYFYHPHNQSGQTPKAYTSDGELIQHQTVKPLALMEWLVTLVTPPGGVVLDPFAGSGTTLEAARNKGFSAIGIEREPDYIRLIETRLGI